MKDTEVKEEVKHTPGPWKTNRLYSQVLNADETIVIAVNPVNENVDESQFGFEQWRANAELIASAPSLLEVNIQLLEALKDYVKEFWMDCSPDFQQHFKAKFPDHNIIKAEQAISKAETTIK